MKKTDSEALKELKEQLNGYAEDGKVSLNKVDETINKIIENDKTAPEDTENKAMEETLNSVRDILEEQKQFNQKLVEQNAVKPKKDWTMNFVGEDEQEKYSDDEKQSVALGRYLNSLFRAYKRSETENDRKTLNAVNSTLTDGAGNYLLPIPTEKLIMDDLSETGLFFSETTVIDFAKGSGKKRKIPTIAAGGHPAPEHVDEGAKKPVKTFTFGQVELELQKYAFLLPFTDELDEDGIASIEQILRTNASQYFGAIFDNILFNGDSDIDGLADLALTDFPITGTSMGGLTIDNLLDIIGSMRSVDLKNAKWYFSPSNWAKIFQKKDNEDRYLLNINDINNRTILGYGAKLSDYALPYDAEAAPDTAFGYFGDFKKIWVGRKPGISISFSTEAAYDDGGTPKYAFQENLIVARLEQRVDMDVPFPSRIVRIKTAAE